MTAVLEFRRLLEEFRKLMLGAIKYQNWIHIKIEQR
jgi:hypothetical protein